MTNKGWAGLLGLSLIGAAGCASDEGLQSSQLSTFDDAGRVSWAGQAGTAQNETEAIVLALQAANIAPNRALRGPGDLKAWELMIADRQIDELGNVHFKLSQRASGLQVEGSGLNVSLRDGAAYALMGRHFSSEGARTAKPLLWTDAIDASLTRFALTKDELNTTPEVTPLLQWEGGRLVSRIRVDLATDLTQPRIYLDAVTGEITTAYDRMHAGATHSDGELLATDDHGAADVELNTYLDDGTWYMRDASRNGGYDYARTIKTLDVDQCGTGTSLCGGEAKSTDNTWPKAHNNSAHHLTGEVLDFWTAQYGLDSYDNRGANLRVFQMQNSGYDNAYWNGTDSIIIGDGSFTGGSGYYQFLSRGDIIAHELGHAVEGALGPDLLYRAESGALSEATADMSAAYFERWFEAQHYGSDNADWLIGEDAINDGSSYPYRAMRNMANPHEMGDPNTWRGAYWANTEDCSPNASNDNCGVHTNSGPANYAFYLQTEGGSGVNDFGIEYDVAPIGIEDAHAIMFQAVRYHLNEGSDYQSYYDALNASAEELFGAGSDQAACIEDSMNAIGLRVCGNNACESGETADSCAADCSDDVQPTPAPTPEPTHEPAQVDFSTFVSDISISQRAQGRVIYDLWATIEISQVSDSGAEGVTPGAWVTLSIADSRGTHVVEGTTDNNGELTVVEYKARRGETFEVCVLDVDHASNIYNPAFNSETCQTYRISR